MRIDMIMCKKCKKQYQKDLFSVCPYCTGQMNNGNEINLDYDEGKRFTETVDFSGGNTDTDYGGITDTMPLDSTGYGGGSFSPTGPPESHIDTVDNMEDTAPPRYEEEKKDEDRFPNTIPEPFINPTPAPAPTPAPQPQPIFDTVPVGEVIEPVVGWLVAIDGKLKGRDFSIKGASATVGRDSSNKIQITGDDRVSREVNCTIRYDYRKKRYRIVPSTTITNPVRLNDDEIDFPQDLRAYDRIEIGSTTFVFVPLCGQQFGWGEESR